VQQGFSNIGAAGLERGLLTMVPQFQDSLGMDINLERLYSAVSTFQAMFNLILCLCLLCSAAVNQTSQKAMTSSSKLWGKHQRSLTLLASVSMISGITSSNITLLML
jgi:hypothetical protein